MTNGNTLTFKWLVPVLLTILFAASGLIIADTRDSVTKTKDKQQEVVSRVVVLETNYTNIMTGICELKAVVKEQNEKLDKLRMEHQKDKR